MSIVACGATSTTVIQAGGYELWCTGTFTFHRLAQPGFIKLCRPNLAPGERIAHVACGDDHTVFITTEGRLWGVGCNVSGQLGLGEDTEYQREFVRIPIPTLRADERIAHVACGADHTVFITTEGRLWGAGCNESGQLGLGEDTEYQCEFVRIPIRTLRADERIAHVVCGADHTVFITTEGRLWGVGCNVSGQLGLGEDTEYQREFVRIPIPTLRADERIAHVACGADHTVFITTEGRLWGAGCNESGQLGLGNTEYQDEFVHIPVTDLIAGERIAQVACGSFHTVFITTKGRLCGAGHNVNSQLVLGVDTKLQREFIHIPIPMLSAGERIAHLAFGADHTIFITTEGRLWGTGGNDRGQLGLRHTRDQKSFVLIGYLLRSPLVSKPSSLEGLDSEYANLIKTISSGFNRFNITEKIELLFKSDGMSSMNISAFIQKEWSRLQLETTTLPQEKQLSYLQLFCWLRLSMSNPKLAGSLKGLLDLKPESYLVSKGRLAQQGVPVNVIAGSAHNPIPIYHLPILPSGRETILLSLSPIIICTAQNNKFDINDIPSPPRQLLDLCGELLGVILDFVGPIDRVSFMNTCNTARTMPAITKSLMAPLAISVRRSDYVRARVIIAPASTKETYSLETMAQIDALLQDIYNKTKDAGIFRLKKLLLAGQVSLLCLLDVHQRLYTPTEKPPTLPPFKVLGVKG